MYHAKHPNVNIQITTSGQGGGAAALQAKFASGEAPDILCLAGYLK
jgi:raffinose/stachyose/melibiose transport system substrate-binding protein